MYFQVTKAWNPCSFSSHNYKLTEKYDFADTETQYWKHDACKRMT